MLRTRHVVLALALICAPAALWLSRPAWSGGSEEDANVIVIPKSAETLVLAVRTGPLPNGSQLVLETDQGRVLGSVAAFGSVGTGAPEQVHLVVADLEGVARGESVTVSAKLVLGEETRPATEREFLGLAITGE